MSRARTLMMTVGLCPLCGGEGLITPIERLPKSGYRMACEHKNGEVHKWAEFNSMASVIKTNKPKPRDPRRIFCPRCHKIGIVNDYRPNKRKPDEVVYYVRHGAIKYGKGNSREQVRHYIYDEDQRKEVLRKLGRAVRGINQK